MKTTFFLIPLFFIASTLQMRCVSSQARVPLHNAYQHRVSIKVHDVKRNTDTLETQPYRDMLQETYVDDALRMALYAHDSDSTYTAPNRRLECFSRDRRPLKNARNNGFFEAVHRAYGDHHALVINPDMVWLTIVQGFAQHVNQNSEALRKHFVQHSGKKPLVVDMTGRVALGDDNSDWDWAFRQFQDSVAANTNANIAQTVAGRFSGTDSDAAAAFDIALLESMKSYFDYWGDVACGIPEIALEGTPEDWKQIEERAARLGTYDLDWWLQDLQPILAEFTRTAQGQTNRDFWAGIFRDLHDMGCGAQSDTFVTGWIVKLFPYIKREGKWQKNPIIGLKTEQLYTVVPNSKPPKNADFFTLPAGQYNLCTDKKSVQVQYFGPKVTLADIPPGISEVILNANNNGSLHKMELKAGFFGMRQDPGSLALRAVIGWAIVDTGEAPDPEVEARYKR